MNEILFVVILILYVVPIFKQSVYTVACKHFFMDSYGICKDSICQKWDTIYITCNLDIIYEIRDKSLLAIINAFQGMVIFLKD